MTYRKAFWQPSFLALSLLALPGCGSNDADSNGACTVADLGDGTSAIRCPDGTQLVVSREAFHLKAEQKVGSGGKWAERRLRYLQTQDRGRL